MKSPAFSFYPDNFIGGTQLFTDEQVGKYIRLLCLQFQNGRLTKDDMMFICKTYDKRIFSKFNIDGDGLYYNERLEYEINRKQKYSESRSNNRKGKTKEKTYDNHMKNTSLSYGKNNNDTDIKSNSVNVIYEKYIDIFGDFPPSHVISLLQGFLDHMDCEVILVAFDVALAENIKKWSYIKQILVNYKANGIKTKADVIADMEKFDRSKTNNKSTSFMDIDTTGWESEELTF